MNTVNVTTVEDWERFQDEVQPTIEKWLRDITFDSESPFSPRSPQAQTKPNRLITTCRIEPHGEITVVFTEDYPHILSKLMAHNDQGSRVYDSTGDKKVDNDLATLKDADNIIDRTQQLLDQAGKPAIRALTRIIDRADQKDVTEAIRNEIDQVPRNPEVDLTPPAEKTLHYTTAHERIPPGDEWHLSFLLTTLKHIERALPDIAIDDVSFEIDIPETDELQGWLQSNYARCGYFALTGEEKPSLIQQANEAKEGNEDSIIELKSAYTKEGKQVSSQTRTILKTHSQQFYEWYKRDGNL